MENENIFFREQDVFNVINIIDVLKSAKTSKESISIAVNSRDGNGKTYFIKWLANYIPTHGNCKDKTLYYNAVEYDDFNDPFLPLAYNIISFTDCEDDASFIEYTKAFFTACGYAALKNGINNFFGLKVAEIFSEGIDAVRETELKNIFNQFDTYFKRREQLAEAINNLIPSDGRLWIFIDELDKCNPEYVIKMLELIKHYFYISNIIFVVSVDLDMLTYALKRIYSQKFDVNAYVRHYFDYIYNPTDINWNQFVDRKINELEMREMLDNSNILFITTIFKNWSFSIREAEICLNSILFFLNFYKNRIHNSSQNVIMIYLYFLILKFKFNSEYIKILRGEYILENTRKAKFEKLDGVLSVNQYIYAILNDLANGKAKDSTSDLIKKYNLFSIEEVSGFSQNIEWVLNYSI